jgi:exosome complex component RRP42
LFDAAGLGAVLALKNAKIPKYDEEKEQVLFGELTDQNIPLSENTPLSITIHKIGNSILVDPTREEEDLSETRVTIGSCDGIISSMQKGEKGSLTTEEFSNVLDMANKVYKDIFKKVENYLK